MPPRILYWEKDAGLSLPCESSSSDLRAASSLAISGLSTDGTLSSFLFWTWKLGDLNPLLVRFGSSFVFRFGSSLVLSLLAIFSLCGCLWRGFLASDCLGGGGKWDELLLLNPFWFVCTVAFWVCKEFDILETPGLLVEVGGPSDCDLLLFPLRMLTILGIVGPTCGNSTQHRNLSLSCKPYYAKARVVNFPEKCSPWTQSFEIEDSVSERCWYMQVNSESGDICITNASKLIHSYGSRPWTYRVVLMRN